MTRADRVPVMTQTALLLILLAGFCRGAEPIDIGSRRELFVDDHLVERMSGGARLRLHRPVETDDVFVHDTAWEGSRSMYHTVFR
ncbi:MAG TPA: hypothetical protein DCE47_07215, partial [Planctomycetaceae bacterium]|nr:hypothetical protein [Planctomycetaceae bacterium]